MCVWMEKPIFRFSAFGPWSPFGLWHRGGGGGAAPPLSPPRRCLIIVAMAMVLSGLGTPSARGRAHLRLRPGERAAHGVGYARAALCRKALGPARRVGAVGGAEARRRVAARAAQGGPPAGGPAPADGDFPQWSDVGWLPPLEQGVDDALPSTPEDAEVDLDAPPPASGTQTIPLFPLGSQPYMPYSQQVLNIFEPRYRALYDDILLNGSRRFAVPLVRPKDDDVLGGGSLQLADTAPVFYLESLKEVSEQTNDSVKYSHSLSKERRKRELQRITKENQKILKRIQNARPTYNHMRWEEEAKRNQDILQNICEFKPQPARRNEEQDEDSIFGYMDFYDSIPE